MKKLFLALAAVAVMGLTACDPDDGNAAARSGVYNPEVKIASMEYGDNDRDQWNWADNKLVSIDHYSSDHIDGSTTFEYNSDNQLTKVTDDDGFTLEYGYTNGLLSSVTVSEMNATFNVNYSNNQISNFQMPISQEMLNSMVQELIGGLLNGDMEDYRTLSAKAGNENMIQFNLVWNNGNVSRMAGNTSITVDLPVSDMLSIATNLFGEEFSAYTDVISGAMQMMGITSVPLAFNMGDTIDLTYDQNHNPLQGFMGEFSPEMIPVILSGNNVTSSTQYGFMSYHLQLPAMLLAMLPAEFASRTSGTIPTGEGETVTFSYQYNSKGYPTVATSSYGEVTSFTYVE